MNRPIWRKPVVQAGMGIMIVAVLAALAISGLLAGLFRTDNFMPHATCYLRDPRVIGLHVTSDLLIGASYLAISIALIRR